MNITRTESAQGVSPVGQSRQDDYERNLQKQINDLEEKMKSITSDKEMTSEQKKNEKQAVQEKIQSLNDELRQYQIQKRQEEAARKQEMAKQAAQEYRGEEMDSKEAGLSDEQEGVILSLSSTTEQIEGLKKVRTHLEAKLRTAETEEEKAELQEKINNISKGIGKKIKVTEDTLSEYWETQKDKSDKTKHKKNMQEADIRQRIVIKESDTDDLMQKKVLSQKSSVFPKVVIRNNK